MINKKRNKIVMYSLISLSAISLAGIGFSAWIIDGSVNANENVNVNVSNMEDRTTLIEVQDSSDLKVSFDYDVDMDKSLRNPNIVFDKDKTEDEDLVFEIIYKITSQSALNDGKHKISLIFDENTLNAYNSVNTTNDYINYDCLINFSFVLPESGTTITTDPTNLNGKIKNDLEYSDSNKTATITSTFNFAWGEYFDGINPCAYKKNDYKAKLTNFQNDVVNSKDKLGINLTISSSYSNS